MHVFKTADGLAISLPPDVVEALHLAEGDAVNISTSGPRSAKLEKAGDTAKTVQDLTKFSWMFPADFVFNRDEANER